MTTQRQWSALPTSCDPERRAIIKILSWCTLFRYFLKKTLNQVIRPQTLHRCLGRASEISGTDLTKPYHRRRGLAALQLLYTECRSSLRALATTLNSNFWRGQELKVVLHSR